MSTKLFQLLSLVVRYIESLEAFAQSSKQRTLTDVACVQKADFESASALDALVAISLEFN
jgi:hypothetical protein